MKFTLFLNFVTTHCVLSVLNKSFETEDSSFIFFSNNDALVEDESQLIGTGNINKVFCENENLSNFLIQLQVINPESIINLASTNNIDNLCKNVSRAQEKLYKYLKTCTLRPDQEKYNQIFEGVKVLHAKLCKDPKFHASFLQYASCYGKLKSEFDSCTGPADWSETSDENKVCKAYKDIADCYFLKVSVLCGTKAANIFKELVVAIANSVITVNCTGGDSNMTYVRQDYSATGASTCLCPCYTVKPFTGTAILVISQILAYYITSKYTF